MVRDHYQLRTYHGLARDGEYRGEPQGAGGDQGALCRFGSSDDWHRCLHGRGPGLDDADNENPPACNRELISVRTR